MIRELYDHLRVRVWAVPQLFDQILAVGRAQKRQRLGVDEEWAALRALVIAASIVGETSQSSAREQSAKRISRLVRYQRWVI